MGILIENDLSGEVFARSIVGIGLNVNQTVFPEELPNPTSLALETGSAWALTEVLGSFYRALSRRYDQLGRGLLDEIDRDYKARIYRLGQESRFALPASKSRFGAPSPTCCRAVPWRCSIGRMDGNDTICSRRSNTCCRESGTKCVGSSDR